jgi:hypothetical protein
VPPRDYAALRKLHGSQRAMEARLGISWRTIQEIEAGNFGDPVPLKYELALRGYVASLAFLPPAES